ncbi:hypothetical protein ACTWP6_04990 [Mycobacterium sp. 4D054]|uniref:hypothetical protein n=1 Tax=Mycobacterium sp. 4D054 TaxID=3457440 RepID=UPI003FD4A37C
MTGPAARDDDPGEAEALARVNRIRVARGLPPIVERDPNAVRDDLVTDRDAMMLAVAALRRADAGGAVPVAFEAATRGFVGDMFDVVPYAVATVIRDRVPATHQCAVTEALDDVLEQFDDGPGGWARAQIVLHHIADATRAGIAAGIVAEGSGAIDHATGLPVPEPPDQLAAAANFAAGFVYADLIDRLTAELAPMAGLPAFVYALDAGHETRCRRAAVLNALAQLRGDTDMQEEAVRVALIVCHGRPGMRPSDVFGAGQPVLLLPADATAADVEAALIAELAAIADTDDGTGP